MTSLSKQYEDLLTYLEKETPKHPETIPLKGVVSESTKEVSKKTKELLIESLEKNIHADVKIGLSNKFSKGFNVDKFEGLMRARLVDEHKRMQSYERPYISVGELISCIRQKYYSRMKYRIDVKQQYGFSYLYLINEVGNKIHDLIQNLYDHTETEKTVVSEKYKVKGRLDGIRDTFLLEYKSIDEKKFQGKYLDGHYHQCIIYSYILNNEYNYNIDTITLVYIIRNLKRIIPFDLPLNDELALSFLERAPLLLNCISEKKVPEPIGSDLEQCRYCIYKEFCKKDESKKTPPFMRDKKIKGKDRSVFLL